MSKDTDNSLFIVSSMPRLYQQILAGVASYEALGNRIISQIKLAHAFRQVEQVKELARVLINIPIREYQLIAQYYLVWCKCRESGFQSEALERIIEQSQTYKSQALSSRAAFEAFRGQLETAMYFYIEALKTARTVSDHIAATLGIAAIKGIEGFHESALKDMESAIPLVRYTESGLFFNFQNSYATELAAIGRTSEARNLSRIVMASSFAPFYPEWQETANDLKEPNRSIVVIGPSKFVPYNILPMPAIEHVETEQTSYNQPAKVFNLQRLRKKMAKGKKSKKDKKDNGENVFDENVDEMDDKDLLATLIQLAASDDADEEKLRKIVKYAMKVMSEPYKPEPDDTNGA